MKFAVPSKWGNFLRQAGTYVRGRGGTLQNIGKVLTSIICNINIDSDAWNKG